MRLSAAAASAPAVPGSDTEGTTACLDRRCMLVAATAGAAALLTACSAMPSQQAGVNTAAGMAAPAPAGSAPQDAGMAPDTAAAASQDGMAGMDDPMASPSAAKKKGAARAKGRTLAKLAELPIGGGMVLPASKLVVTRPTANTVKAFSAVCTHQGCIVSQVADGTINCPCHGARFDIKTGAPVAGPARAPLAPAKVAIHGANVVKI
jgi:Rieske Fe-S protein